MLTGDPLDAQRAYDLGMVCELTEPGQAPRPLALAEKISSAAVRHTMRIIRDGGPDVRGDLEAEPVRIRELGSTEDYREGPRIRGEAGAGLAGQVSLSTASGIVAHLATRRATRSADAGLVGVGQVNHRDGDAPEPVAPSRGGTPALPSGSAGLLDAVESVRVVNLLSLLSRPGALVAEQPGSMAPTVYTTPGGTQALIGQTASEIQAARSTSSS